MIQKTSFRNLLLLSSVISAGMMVSVTPTHAAFEWTPPAKIAKQPAPAPAPVANDPSSESQGDKMIAVPTEPVSKEMTLRIPAGSKVAQDLKSLIEEAEASNDLTPLDEIPAAEQIDEVVVESEVLSPEPSVVVEETTVTETVTMPEPPVVDGRPIALSNAPAPVQEPVMAPPAPQVQIEEDVVEMVPVIDTPVVEEAPETAAETPETHTDVIVAVTPEVEDVPKVADSVVETKPAEVAAAPTPTPAPAPVVSAPDVEQSSPAAANILHGFGKDLPLIMAVRQIVPAQVVYSFGEGVDLGKTVSWRGGKSWQETLLDLALTNDMKVSFAEGQVRLSTAKNVPPPPVKEIVQEEQKPVVEAVETSGVVPLPDAVEPPASDNAPSDVAVGADVVKHQEMTENQILEEALGEAIIIKPVEDLPLEAIASSPAVRDEAASIAEVVEEIELPTAPVEKTADASITELTEKILLDDTGVEETLTETVPASMDVTEVSVSEKEEPVELQQAPVDLPPVVDETPVAVAVEDEVTVAVVDTQPSPQPVPLATFSGKEKTWKVKKNSDLRETLQKWSDDAGVALKWDMPQDYQIGYMVWVDGSFGEAIETLMDGYRNDAGIIPQATFLQEETGPVLVIEPAL